MRKHKNFIVLLFLLCINGIAGPVLDGKKITIVNNGSAKSVIVMASGSSAEMKAAKELQKYIEKMSSAKLEILKGMKVAVSGQKIIISSGHMLPGFNTSTKTLNKQGFIIKVLDKGTIIIAANSDAGIQNGVYYFLQKYCGVRWFFPGKLGTVIPKSRTIKVLTGEDIQNPDFQMRFALFMNTTLEKNWKKHNLMANNIKFYGGHSYCLFLPPEKYFTTHPEYFAEIHGERKKPEFLDNSKARNWGEWQICTSNPEVIDVFAKNVCEAFRKRPDTKVISISPNDGGGWCQCKNCKALDKQPGIITDRILDFSNKVAEKVAKKFPDRYLMLFAYSAYIKPPEKIKLHPNMIIIFAYSAAESYIKKFSDERLGYIKKWAESAKNMYIYEYYISEAWPHFTPRFIPHAIDRELKYFKKLGIKGYNPQASNDWAMNGINYYVASQLLWDSSLNVDDIIDEYCRKLFGNSSAEMKEYFISFEDGWATGMSKPGTPRWSGVTFSDTIALDIYNDELLAKLSNNIETALKKANSEKVKKRIKMFATALTFTKNHIAILKAFAKLSDSGITITNYKNKSVCGKKICPQETEKMLKAAAKAINEQLAFCESQKKLSTIGYRWAYDPGTRPDRYIPVKKRQLAIIKRYIDMYSGNVNETKYNIPELWKFRADKNNRGIIERWPQKAWPENLTSDLNVLTFWNNQKAELKNYSGIGWYRTELNLPANARGRKVIISFGGVDADAVVYINGKKTGGLRYSAGMSWKEPFEVDISEFVNPGKNIVTVRVDGHAKNGGIWQPVKVYSPKSKVIVNGNFTDGLKGWSWCPVKDSVGKYLKPKIVSLTDGKGKCVMRNLPGQVLQKICLVPGKKYQITGQVKTARLAKGAFADVYINLGPGSNVPLFSTRENSNWVSFKKEFEVSKPEVRLCLRLLKGGEAYFDNLTITASNKK